LYPNSVTPKPNSTTNKTKVRPNSNGVYDSYAETDGNGEEWKTAR